MTGEQRIAAPRPQVWEALNDAEVLKRCIPGCQSLERESAERYKAAVAIKVGPIGARFAGAITLSDVDPANAYTLTLEGQGGSAGFAKGSARVRLTDDGDATLLRYDADVQVGGRLAQVGGALIDSTAQQIAGNFFERLGQMAVQPALPVPPETLPGVATPVAAAQRPVLPMPAEPRLPMVWMLTVVVAALVGFLIGRAQGGELVPIWVGLSIGLLLIVVSAAAFEFGRRSATPILMLDPSLLARLQEGSTEKCP